MELTINYIDQVNHQIYNVDSLPTKTRTAAVLATISSKNSSPIFIMHKNCPEKIDSAKYYSSTDSIDFSQPRMVRVYNNSLNAYVTYTVKVNVHQQEGNEFNWQAKAQLNEQLAALSDLKVLAWETISMYLARPRGNEDIQECCKRR